MSSAGTHHLLKGVLGLKRTAKFVDFKSPDGNVRCTGTKKAAALCKKESRNQNWFICCLHCDFPTSPQHLKTTVDLKNTMVTDKKPLKNSKVPFRFGLSSDADLFSPSHDRKTLSLPLFSPLQRGSVIHNCPSKLFLCLFCACSLCLHASYAIIILF